MRLIILALIVFTASACSTVIDPLVYKIPKRQGNILDDKKIQMLKPGLNKRQVAFLLGSPLAKDPFDHSVWHYLYYLKDTDNTVSKKTLSLKFNGDLLEGIDNQYSKDAEKFQKVVN
jgi:outer membrane protein assembly factor BamE